MDGMKCVSCGKTAKPAKLSFQGQKIDGWRCSCGEEYFDPEQAQRILLLNQVRKENFRVKVGKVRSNLILRIPKRIADALELNDGEEVTIRVESGNEIRVLTG
jgi:CxxC motif-containing protein